MARMNGSDNENEDLYTLLQGGQFYVILHEVQFYVILCFVPTLSFAME